MNLLIPMDDYGVFVDKKDTVRVDSRFVAQFFEKRHDHVLRDIAKITAPTSGLSACKVSGFHRQKTALRPSDS